MLIEIWLEVLDYLTLESYLRVIDACRSAACPMWKDLATLAYSRVDRIALSLPPQYDITAEILGLMASHQIYMADMVVSDVDVRVHREIPYITYTTTVPYEGATKLLIEHMGYQPKWSSFRKNHTEALFMNRTYAFIRLVISTTGNTFFYL